MVTYAYSHIPIVPIDFYNDFSTPVAINHYPNPSITTNITNLFNYAYPTSTDCDLTINFVYYCFWINTCFFVDLFNCKYWYTIWIILSILLGLRIKSSKT